MEGGVERCATSKCASAISEIERIFSRSASVRIGWRTSRRLVEADVPSRSNRFGRGPMIETRLITTVLADRVDRRVGDLREVLLEVGGTTASAGPDSAEIGVAAHRAMRRSSPSGGHRRHQDVDVFLRIAERLLAIEQQQVGTHALGRCGRQFFQHDLGAAEPLVIGVAVRQRRLDLVVGNEAASSRSTSSILRAEAITRVTIWSSGIFSTPISDAITITVVAGHEITRRAAGRWRSSVAPIWRPSVKAIAAGPSHGSIIAA